MSDYKSLYSKASQYYLKEEVSTSQLEKERYDRSKARETAHNEAWKKQPVNLNEICDKFTPGDSGHKDGVKWKFEGNIYQVVVDMASGYLRIFNKNIKRWVKLDGTPGKLSETHFKIFKREEM